MPPKRDKADNTAMRELKRAIQEGAPKKLYLFHGEEDMVLRKANLFYANIG